MPTPICTQLICTQRIRGITVRIARIAGLPVALLALAACAAQTPLPPPTPAAFADASRLAPTPELPTPELPTSERPTREPLAAESSAPVPTSSTSSPDAASATPTALDTPTQAPTATITPQGTPIVLPPAPPADDLAGRIVLQMGSVTYDLDLAARTPRRLWSAPGTSQGGGWAAWAVAPNGREVAYRAERDGLEHLFIRALEPDAPERVLATDTSDETYLADPAWSADGKALAYAQHGHENWGEPVRDLCSFRAVDRDGTADRVLWSGTMAAFNQSAGCPGPIFWESGSGRIAVPEHCFECTFSSRIDLLDAGAEGVSQRLDIQAHFQARAQSADRVWLAWVDSASYYGEPIPLWGALFAHPDYWPGRASVRRLNLVTGGILDVISADTVAGFTAPVWSPDGTWLAFAEPLGAMATPTAAPPIKTVPEYAGYQDRRPRFAGTGTRIWAVSREGEVRMKLDLDGLNAWPVAISPDGRHVLVAESERGRPTLRLYAHRVPDGAGGLLATLGAPDADVAWVR